MPRVACTTDRPPLLSKRVHSLMLDFPFGVPSSVPPSCPFRSLLPCLGFFPLRGNTGIVHSVRENTFSHYVPPSGFLDLSAVYSDFQFRGLIASHNHVQGSSVQGFLSFRSLPDSSSVRTLIALGPFRSPVAETSSFHFQDPHLQGFTPRSEAFFRFGV
jgi:hypothetical protein